MKKIKYVHTTSGEASIFIEQLLQDYCISYQLNLDIKKMLDKNLKRLPVIELDDGTLWYYTDLKKHIHELEPYKKEVK